MAIKTPKDVLDAIVKLARGVEDTSEKEVVLAETPEEKPEEKKVEEAPKEEVEEPKVEYATVSMLNELKDMVTKVMEVMSPSSPDEVPAKLEAEEVVEEVVEEELSEVKETVEETEEVELAEEVEEKVVHDPEVVVEKKSTILYAQNRAKTTEDHVFDSLFGNKSK